MKYEIEYDAPLLKEIIEFIRETEKVTLKEVCVEFDLYTREAHRYLALLFALQKIRPQGRSIFIGNKRMPVVFWVATKGKIQNLSPDSLLKRAERKANRKAKVDTGPDTSKMKRLDRNK